MVLSQNSFWQLAFKKHSSLHLTIKAYLSIHEFHLGMQSIDLPNQMHLSRVEIRGVPTMEI